METRKLGQLIEQYYCSHRRQFLAYCYHQLGNVEDAEDTLQDACFEAIRCIGRYDERRCCPGTWFDSILRNKILETRRRVSRRVARISESIDNPLFVVVADNPTDSIIEQSRTKTIMNALSMLSQRDQFVITRSLLHGEDGRSLAVMLGCSEAAVRNRLMMAKKRLRSNYNYLLIAESLEY